MQIIESDSFDLLIARDAFFKLNKQWDHFERIMIEKNNGIGGIENARLFGNELFYTKQEDKNLVWKKFNIKSKDTTTKVCSVPLFMEHEEPPHIQIISERFTYICKIDTTTVFDLLSKTFVNTFTYTPAHVRATAVDVINNRLYCGLDRTMKSDFQDIDILRIASNLEVKPLNSIIQPHVRSWIMFECMDIAPDGTVYFEYTDVHETRNGNDYKRTDTTYLYKTNPYNGDNNLYSMRFDFESYNTITISYNYFYRVGITVPTTLNSRSEKHYIEAIPISSLNDKWVKLTKK
jgi:hypothetical protein